MAQRKLICSSPDTAQRLAKKLAQHRPTRVFSVYGVTMGHQVIEIRKFAGFGYRWDGSTWTKTVHKVGAPLLKVEGQSREELTITVTLPFVVESKAYIDALVDGTKHSFGKTTICGFKIADGTVEMVLPAKVAHKRGLVAAA
jgi:hypothetical protein